MVYMYRQYWKTRVWCTSTAIAYGYVRDVSSTVFIVEARLGKFGYGVVVTDCTCSLASELAS